MPYSFNWYKFLNPKAYKKVMQEKHDAEARAKAIDEFLEEMETKRTAAPFPYDASAVTKFADFGADLTLCADTHGGMFRLPFVGPVYDTQTRIKFPNLKNTGIPVYDKGWFDYQGGSMFITSGVGDSPYPVRFFNRPEIVCLDILPSEVTE